jgi:microcystin-dependent protein
MPYGGGSSSYTPRGWARCNGPLLRTSQYQTLLWLLGTTYGCDGVSTLPCPT